MSRYTISGSVNAATPEELAVHVKNFQQILNAAPLAIIGKKLVEDGVIGPATVAAAKRIWLAYHRWKNNTKALDYWKKNPGWYSAATILRDVPGRAAEIRPAVIELQQRAASAPRLAQRVAAEAPFLAPYLPAASAALAGLGYDQFDPYGRSGKPDEPTSLKWWHYALIGGGVLAAAGVGLAWRYAEARVLRAGGGVPVALIDYGR